MRLPPAPDGARRRRSPRRAESDVGPAASSGRLHHSLLSEACDVTGAVAELAEDRLGVLAGVGARGFEAARRAAQGNRLADQLDIAKLGMMYGLSDAEMLDLRVGKHL